MTLPEITRYLRQKRRSRLKINGTRFHRKRGKKVIADSRDLPNTLCSVGSSRPIVDQGFTGNPTQTAERST